MTTTHGTFTGLILQPGARATYDKYGVISLRQSYKCPSASAFTLAPVAWAVHPIYSDLQNDISQMEVDLGDDAVDAVATVICTYVGQSAGSTVPPIYEVEMSLSEDPIDTHPDFVSTIGGTRSAPLNNAVFNSDGTFKGFPANATNNLGGVRSFLNPQAIWRETSFASSSPSSLSSIGKIQTPSGSPPSLGTGRNWLFSAYTWTRQGSAYRVTKEWRSSGIGGWNTLIYA